MGWQSWYGDLWGVYGGECWLLGVVVQFMYTIHYRNSCYILKYISTTPMSIFINCGKLLLNFNINEYHTVVLFGPYPSHILRSWRDFFYTEFRDLLERKGYRCRVLSIQMNNFTKKQKVSWKRIANYSCGSFLKTLK